ncbi:MAG: hypothetical protein M1812_001362 [Candelaria pacifica]|nr:MAG: hypothetical protein M1812_001362 [Candelaria pacifica]
MLLGTALLGAGLLATSAQAACSNNLLIDNYSKYSSNANSLGAYTSDDGSCTTLKADTANKKITFKANANCYFYTTFPDPCEKASTDGYNGLTFSVKAPASGSSLRVEIQTSTTCSATAAAKSYYFTVSGLTGNTQTVTIPFSQWAGANAASVKSFVFEEFSNTSGTWEIGQTSLVCGSSSGGSSSIIVTSTTKSSSVPVSSSTQTSSSSLPSGQTSSSKTSSSQSGSSSSNSSSAPGSSTLSTVVRSSTTSRVSVAPAATTSASSGTCTDLLIDDWSSQSRLTFLFYNAMLQPSSDDGTMTSVVVANNHVTLTKKDAASYFYSMLGCTSATNKYGGIGLTIKAAAGTTLQIELQTSASCDGSSNPTSNVLSSTDLGWTFSDTEKYYTIPFSKFAGLDTGHVTAIVFSNLNKVVNFGPLAFYCGTTGSAYPVPSSSQPAVPTSTVPATTGPNAFVIDAFANADSNALGFYHGGDDATTYKISGGKITFTMKGNSDLSWYTQVSGSCSDFTANDNGYLHIAYTGSAAFSVALQQHNPTCNENIAPYPQTWDDVEAGRYSNSAKTDIYIPMTHFNIDKKKTIGFSFKGFYTSATTTVSKVELVKTVPSGFLVPSKLDTAPLVFACTRPNSFAFAIDDGDPALAQQVLQAVNAANIKVTFFTVGAALLDTSNNLSNVYTEMLGRGHQIAYHSYTHPPMEGLPDYAAIDSELTQDIAAVKKTLNTQSKYFRPPFGTEGARVRERLASVIPGSKFVEWSVDVEDYLWALSTTPEKQLDAFKRDIGKGGNLVVMHYLYPTTVQYLPQFIALAKATGKQLMRVDQCMQDPDAPPL